MSGLGAWRCARGHVHLHGGGTCHACGDRLHATRVAREARIIVTTTVRVSPRARPFVLGLAVTRCGRARTLCVVEGPLRADGRDAVWLRVENGVVVARGRALRGRNRVRSATRGDSRRS